MIKSFIQFSSFFFLPLLLSLQISSYVLSEHKNDFQENQIYLSFLFLSFFPENRFYGSVNRKTWQSESQLVLFPLFFMIYLCVSELTLRLVLCLTIFLYNIYISERYTQSVLDKVVICTQSITLFTIMYISPEWSVSLNKKPVSISYPYIDIDSVWKGFFFIIWCIRKFLQ